MVAEKLYIIIDNKRYKIVCKQLANAFGAMVFNWQLEGGKAEYPLTI